MPRLSSDFDYFVRQGDQLILVEAKYLNEHPGGLIPVARHVVHGTLSELSRRANDHSPDNAAKIAAFVESPGISEAIESAINQRYVVATAKQRALIALDTWSLILPSRINTEVLGDFTERISQRAAIGATPWRILVLTLAAIFWSGWYAFGEIVRQVIGRKAA